jgi:protein involved in polysaccharide export with SLBB domain
MARARDLLRRRLIRRGLAPTAGALAGLCDPAGISAAVALTPLTPGLVRSSVEAAMRVAAGQATAEVVLAGVAALVRRVLWSLVMIKCKNWAAIVMVTGLLVLGAQLWAQQPRRERREAPPRRELRTEAGATKRPASMDRSQLAHVVEPPDLLLVEVLEALPGRPISGERLVRPDGKISLGFYGDVEVAGLTVPQVKEKIVLHLRKYLSDETLGLVKNDPETGEPVTGEPVTRGPKTDQSGNRVSIDPKDTDRVFVEVTAYNSGHYYIEGEVATPGRIPFTGSERVLDVIHYAGGLLPSAHTGKIKLIRSFPKGSPVQVLPIDYEEITMGTDSSTNYEIMPFDRIVVPRDDRISKPLSVAPGSSGSPRSPEPPSETPRLYFDRQSDSQSAPSSLRQRDLERRLDGMEKKLDAILKRLGDRKP